jgi:heme exporter protein A
MLRATELECVRGNRTIFQRLTFSLHPGQCLQLTGPNGSGKTSLLRILCGLMEPSHGTVSWKGIDVRHLAEGYRCCITYLGHRHGIKEELTPLENLQISSGLNGAEISRACANRALEYIGLADRESVPARFLSEGERRRIALARLVVSRTEFWLLDEVLTSLDRSGVQTVHMLIEDHRARGGMAVVATHQDLDLAPGPFQRIELVA